MKKPTGYFNPSSLVLKAQQGDERAFQSLVEHYEPRVKKLVARYVPDISEVSDVTQEIFLKIFKALKRFRGDSQFYTWLYRITINTIKNYLSYQNTHVSLRDLSLNDEELGLYWLKQIPIDGATPETTALESEAESLLLTTIKSMPKELRTSLLLRDLQGLSYLEIATAMNCPIGTVRSRIFRARNIVMQIIMPKIP